MFEDEENNQPEDITPDAQDIVNESASSDDNSVEQEVPSMQEEAVNTEYNEESYNDNDNDDETVTVQPVEFASFEDLNQVQGTPNKNLDILLDVKLQLTVELGRTELPIKKVLELTRGSIITLDKVAGEPVELFANGKLIAHGEVVVIEDNFGLRITNITDPEDRLANL